jgi:hypothetical protein
MFNAAVNVLLGALAPEGVTVENRVPQELPPAELTQSERISARL